MSSGPRGGPPSGRYGNDYEYNKRRRVHYPASTRRDFKSGTSSAGPGSSSLSSYKPKRSDRPETSFSSDNGYGADYSRSRYNSELKTPPGSRSNSYTKDVRYSSYSGNKPKSFGNYYQDRKPSGGSGSSNPYHKREPEGYLSYNAALRESEPAYARETWRSERPLTFNGFPASRNNPNNIPVRGSSSLSHSGPGDSRVEFDREYSGGRRSQSSSDYGRRPLGSYPTKDKSRGSALTNSVRSEPSPEPGNDDRFHFSREEGRKYDTRNSPRSTSQPPDDTQIDDSTIYPDDTDDGENTAQDSVPVSRLESPQYDVKSAADGDDDDDDDVADDEGDNYEPEVAAEIKLPARAQLEIEKNIQAVTSSEAPSNAYGCVFPMTKLEHELLVLQTELVAVKDKRIHNNEIKPTTSLDQYEFYGSNLVRFARSFEQLLAKCKSDLKQTKRKKLALWVEYRDGLEQLEKFDTFASEQLKVIRTPDDEFNQELESIDVRVKNEDPQPAAQSPDGLPTVPTGRRGRNHGDLVTTEAEFQEILKRLEDQQNDDPMAKAIRVSAAIPDQILDPIEEEQYRFADSNNIVANKQQWVARMKGDFWDTFTEDEHERFCEAFCRAPKRFGEVSKEMGGMRSSEECVVHYYMTKKAVNYKNLVAQYKKKVAKKVTRRKPSKVKPQVSSATTSDPTSASELAEPQLDIGAAAVVQTEEKSAVRDSQATEVPPSPDLPCFPDPQPAVAVQADAVSVPEPTVLPIPVAKHENSPPDEKRKLISSYWSITEVNEFPQLLAAYGSRWSRIADHLSTKSATMVRNFFQRNAEKHGWNDLVAAADHRFNQETHGLGLNTVDSTIVVKPQKTTQVDISHPGVYEKEFERQEPLQKPAEAPKVQYVVEQVPPIQMGTFQHLAPKVGNETTPHKASVSHLLSTPLGSERITFAPHPITKEGTKPSIMSLLNSDPATFSPYKREPKPSPPPAPPTHFSRPNDLAALLNAPSSPVPVATSVPSPSERRSSIKSLLLDET